MDRKESERIFRWQITAEMKLFKERVLQMGKEEIYDSAYRIDCTIRIYKILLESGRRMEEPELAECIRTGSLLDFLYENWLKEPDSQEEELEHSLCSIIRNIITGRGCGREKNRKAG